MQFLEILNVMIDLDTSTYLLSKFIKINNLICYVRVISEEFILYPGG